MAAQPRLTLMGASADTTYTKIFVGGLAWETQRETMRRYFEQFGEILEAVVITDKNTGRSKGYGFVTFKEMEAAYRALQDPAPVIDGRRANCNLAAFGAVQRPIAFAPQIGMVRLRPAIGSNMQPYQGSNAMASYLQQPNQFPYPYYNYGYSGAYSGQENMYPMSYYGAVYGTGTGGQQQTQYPAYYTATGSGVYQNINPAYYTQLVQNNQAQNSYGLQYASGTQMLQYPNFAPQQFGSNSLTSPLPTSTTGIIGGSSTTGIGSSSVHLNSDKRN